MFGENLSAAVQKAPWSCDPNAGSFLLHQSVGVAGVPRYPDSGKISLFFRMSAGFSRI
jgi:hypothetical protein